MKNKLRFYLITIVIYVSWMVGILLAQRQGIQEMILTILFFVIYLNIGMVVFHKLHFRYYKGLHKGSKSDTWFDKFMSYIAWPVVIINFIEQMNSEKDNQSMFTKTKHTAKHQQKCPICGQEISVGENYIRLSTGTQDLNLHENCYDNLPSLFTLPKEEIDSLIETARSNKIVQLLKTKNNDR